MEASIITLGPSLTGHKYEGTVNYQGILLGVEHKHGDVNPFSKRPTKAAYGEIPGTSNIDGDPVDFLLGHDMDSDIVFVLQQTIPNTQGDPHVGDIRANGGPGQYDEDKLVFGVWTEADAVALYEDYYGGSGRTVKIGPAMSVDYLRDHVLFCPARNGLPVFKSLTVPPPRDGWPRAWMAGHLPSIFQQLDAIVALSKADPAAACCDALACWSPLQKSEDTGPQAPAGFEPIPGGKHGGYRKRKASGKGYDYWYPGQHEAQHHPDWEPDPTAGTGTDDLKPGSFVFVLGLGANTVFRYHPEHDRSEEGMTWVQNVETGEHVAVREANIQRARGYDADARDRKERGSRPPRPGASGRGRKPRPSSGDNRDRRGLSPGPTPGDGKPKRTLPPYDHTVASPDAEMMPKYEGPDGAQPGTVAWNIENGVYIRGQFKDTTDGSTKKGVFVPPEHEAAFLGEMTGLMQASTNEVCHKLGIKVRDSAGHTQAWEEIMSGARLGLVLATHAYDANVPWSVQASAYMTVYAREAASRELGRGVPMATRYRRMIEGFLAARARAWKSGDENDVATIAREWSLTKKQAAPKVDWGRYVTTNREGKQVVKDQGTMQVPMGPWHVLDPNGETVGEARPGKIALAEDMLKYVSADRMEDASWLEMDNRNAILPHGAGADHPVGTALFFRQEVDSILTQMSETDRSALVLRWGLDGSEPMDYADIANALKLKPKRQRERTGDAASEKRAQRHLGKQAVEAATRAFRAKAEETDSPVGKMGSKWSDAGPDNQHVPIVVSGPSQGELVESFGGGDAGQERLLIYLAGVGMGVGEEFRKVLEQEAKGGIPEAQSRAIREAYHDHRDKQRVRMFQMQTRHTTIDPSEVRELDTGTDPESVTLYADEIMQGYMQVVAKRGLPGPGDGGPPRRSTAGRSRVWSDERLDRFLGRWRPKGDGADGQSSEESDNG